MNLRRVLAGVAVATMGVVGAQATTSAAAPPRQNFTITFDITEDVGTVVASGAINATGQDIAGDTVDQFVFPDGTLTVAHAPVHYNEHFNAKKCTLTFHETGNYVISSGTGAYEGVSGSGRYRAVGNFEDACGDSPTGSYTVTARGTVNLPTP
jgi:hypothetical protein